MSHSFQGRTIRSRPIPIPPTSAPGRMIQYRTLGRCSTYCVRSALKTMFMLPALPICPSIGRPSLSATMLRPPSAPIM